MLAVCLPNGVSHSNKARSHVKFLIFCPILNFLDRTVIQFLGIKYHKIQPAGKRAVSRGREKLTGSHEEASSSLYCDSANASRIFNGYVLRCSGRD
jgi:hypothetical protein